MSVRTGFVWKSQQTDLFFYRFFLSGFAGEERPGHAASSLQGNAERQTTNQAHIHTSSQCRATTSALPRRKVENPKRSHVGRRGRRQTPLVTGDSNLEPSCCEAIVLTTAPPGWYTPLLLNSTCKYVHSSI